MKKLKTRGVFLLLCFFSATAAAWAQESVLVQQVDGEALMRDRNDSNWKYVPLGANLPLGTSVRTLSGAQISFLSPSHKKFLLPEQAEIETDELVEWSQVELVIRLTALEMLRLPRPQRPAAAPQSVFVIHGSEKDTLHLEEEAQIKNFYNRQLRAVTALYEQKFFSGFLLKWTRLQVLSRQYMQREHYEMALIVLSTLDMPSRRQAVLEEMNQRWPK